MDRQVIALQEQKQFDPRSLTAFRLAEHYCWIFAASCCVHFWHHNQELMDTELPGLDWLNLAIQFILDKLNGRVNIEPKLQESMAEHLVRFYEHHKMFSMVPIKIPD